MGFAVSARHTAAGAAEIIRRRQMEHLRKEQARINSQLAGMRKAEFEAFERLMAEEESREEARISLEALRRRNRSAEIIREVAEAHGVTAGGIIEQGRERKLSDARQHAIYEVRRQCTHLSMPQIGRIFGGRDHTTILHSIRVWPAKAAKLGISCEPIVRDQAQQERAA